MVWYKLKIGYFDVRYTPIKTITKEYETCDSEGNILTRVSGSYTKGHYVNEKTNETFEKTFKLINGKVRDKFSKTKEVSDNQYKEVDLKEIDDLIIDKEYLCVCDPLYNDLISSGKALKFGFTSGNGFKVYYAYLKPSEFYKGFLIMSLGLGRKSDVITELVSGLKEQKKVKEIETIVQGVDKAKVEDLIQI